MERLTSLVLRSIVYLGLREGIENGCIWKTCMLFVTEWLLHRVWLD